MFLAVIVLFFCDTCTYLYFRSDNDFLLILPFNEYQKGGYLNNCQLANFVLVSPSKGSSHWMW